MSLPKFTPQSPDRYLKNEADMKLAKFGHLNELVRKVNEITNNVYADNAAAVAAGLKVGTLYSTVTGEVRVVV
jgi:hypothetical protein